MSSKEYARRPRFPRPISISLLTGPGYRRPRPRTAPCRWRAGGGPEVVATARLRGPVGARWHPGHGRGCEAPHADDDGTGDELSLIHISEPTRRTPISYAV